MVFRRPVCDNNSERFCGHVQTLRLHKSILGFPNHCQDKYCNHPEHPPADCFLKPVHLNMAGLFSLAAALSASSTK